MGAPLADPTRIGNWLGLGALQPGSEDLIRATEVVRTISDLVRAEAGQTEWNGWTLQSVPDNIAAIVLMVSVECWVNPDNKMSVTIDDVTRRYDTGNLFTPAQIATIRSFHPKRSMGLGTVQFSRGLDAPSIALPDGDGPHLSRASASAVRANVVGGSPVILYDGHGY